MEHVDIVLRSDRRYAASSDARLLNELNAALLDKAPVSSQLGSRIFATEALAEPEMVQIQSAASNLQATLASVVGSLGLADKRQTMVQESAAIVGALCAAAPASFVGRKIDFPTHSTKNQFVVPAGGVPDYVGHRSNIFAAEAFDNRETRSAVLYTMAYNYSVARQDEFGETIWPTLTLPADQVGFGIVVNRLTVHRGVSHTIDGKVVEFNKVDLMRAEADHNVLLKEKTRIFPVVRPAAADKFVDAALIAPRDIDNEGVTISTAPYRTGVDVGIIGLSQTDAMLDGGMANQTDTLDPAVSLEKVYVKVGDDIVAFNVYSQPTANFAYAPQGLDKQRNLNFRTKALNINAKTVRYDGGALTSLASVVTDNLTVVVELAATGEANTEFGSVVVYGNKVAIVKVLDEDGVALPASNAAVQDLAALFASAQIIGYDLRAYRTNINMRERGDFIDRNSFTQLYEVPLLSPITAQRPQNTDGQLDAGDFEALVTATRFRLKNDAVTAILDNVLMLDEHVRSGVVGDEIPSALGAARFHVKPTFFGPAPIDVTTIVDSLSSVQRVKDLQAAIVNIVRDYAFRMYVESEYPAAASALGVAGAPTIVIATDPVLHRYLTVDGDLRTLTEKFNVRIVSTLDRRMAGKLFMTFSVFDENRNQAPNLLSWGNLVWSPEVVMSASVPRGESLSRETIVQPRYRFVMHLPVATMLQFVNVPDVFLKMPLLFKNA